MFLLSFIKLLSSFFYFFLFYENTSYFFDRLIIYYCLSQPCMSGFIFTAIVVHFGFDVATVRFQLVSDDNHIVVPIYQSM